MPLQTHTKPLNTPTTIINHTLNSYPSIGPFYSIKLKEMTSILGINFHGLPCARIACVVLWHSNKYTRNIQRDYIRIYGIGALTIRNVLKKLTDQGLLKPVNCKRPTNIGLHVPLIAYHITVEGRQTVKMLNDLLENKILKLKAQK